MALVILLGESALSFLEGFLLAVALFLLLDIEDCISEDIEPESDDSIELVSTDVLREESDEVFLLLCEDEILLLLWLLDWVLLEQPGNKEIINIKDKSQIKSFFIKNSP